MQAILGNLARPDSPRGVSMLDPFGRWRIQGLSCTSTPTQMERGGPGEA
jgi:hypothetical protein